MLDMLTTIATAVTEYPDDSPHSLDRSGGTSHPMFYHWERQFQRHGQPYSQDAQRWKVLLFSHPRSTERDVRYNDFKSAMHELIDRYDNDIVIHGDVPLLRLSPPYLISFIDLTAYNGREDSRRAHIGNVSTLVALARLECKQRDKIYYIPPVPSSRPDDFFDRLYCTETVAYEATHPRSAKFHLFQNPAQALSYHTAMLTGSVEYWQMGPAGLGLVLTPEYGEILVFIADPADAALFYTSALLAMVVGGAIPFRAKLGAVWVRARSRM
jgi:hypothetical protein